MTFNTLAAMTDPTRPIRMRGFTLLEALVTVTVAAVLITVAVPAFRNVIMDSRMTASTNEFVTAINLARSSATRYQRNATVCRSTDFSAAVPSCANGTDWSVGWIVWVDRDRDSAVDANEVLAVHEPLPDSSTLSSTANNRFTYNARGFSTVAGDTLTLCDDRDGETGRSINVNNAGRTNVARVGC